MDCRRAWISGLVQGVGFRASAAHEAERMGLRGYAANLPDGRVEVLLYGEAASVRRMLAWLEEGPSPARVEEVVEQAEDPDAVDAPAHFQIR